MGAGRAWKRPGAVQDIQERRLWPRGDTGWRRRVKSERGWSTGRGVDVDAGLAGEQGDAGCRPHAAGRRR